jgi:predicted HNH restriction endonuclease
MDLAFNEKNIQRMEGELKKCTPMCSNCHRELHFDVREKGKEI